MSFSSLLFLLYISVVFTVYHIIPQKYQYVLIFFTNCIFYLFFGIQCFLVLFSIVVITFCGALMISKKPSISKVSFLITLVLSLLVYTCFKSISVFTGFTSIIGLSFYSLSAIGYLIDVYKKSVLAEKNFIKYFSFIAFFPTIVSGPIQRSNSLLRQIQNGTTFSYDLAKSGILMMLAGYFEKILIADRIHLLINPIFENIRSQTGATLLFGCMMYGIELYADFAGYSFIAIGSARLLGFDLDDNFRQPYFACSIKDFWRRWHISLSTWLKDYIYIPLGGNRKGPARKNLNLLITFIISGIWHGNGFKYIAWGILHGLYQIIGSVLFSKKIFTSNKVYIPNIIKCIVTFILVDIGWIFFRAGSLKDVLIICKRIVFDFSLIDTIKNHFYLPNYDLNRFILLIIEILAVFIIDLLREKQFDIIEMLNKLAIPVRWSLYMMLVLTLIIGFIYNFGLDSSTFIYAQF